MKERSKSELSFISRKCLSVPKLHYMNHILNKSRSRNVPSIGKGPQRLILPKSQSPNKFYNVLLQQKQHSTSFGFGTKTDFSKKQFIPPTKYKIKSTFDINVKKGPSFGISRQEFYKSKQERNLRQIGPGQYQLGIIMNKTKRSFIGLKFPRKDSTIAPGPGTYQLSMRYDQEEGIKNKLKIKAPRIKTQYFEKAALQKYDNKVPGPGSYNLLVQNANSLQQSRQFSRSKLPQCPRFKIPISQTPPPGHYNDFSQFG